jgi:hypothetical protein
MNAYCFVLRLERAFRSRYPSTKRFFLSAKSAGQAVLLASDDPKWRVVGIEPAEMSAQLPGFPHRYNIA